jgi:hypothetical protein
LTMISDATVKSEMINEENDSSRSVKFFIIRLPNMIYN